MSAGEPWVLSKDFQALRRATRWKDVSGSSGIKDGDGGMGRWGGDVPLL